MGRQAGGALGPEQAFFSKALYTYFVYGLMGVRFMAFGGRCIVLWAFARAPARFAFLLDLRVLHEPTIDSCSAILRPRAFSVLNAYRLEFDVGMVIKPG